MNYLSQHALPRTATMLAIALLSIAGYSRHKDDLWALFHSVASASSSATAPTGMTIERIPLAASREAGSVDTTTAGHQTIDPDAARLLSAAAAPPELVITGAGRLSNDDVAGLFPEREAALQTMVQAGRVEGAWVAYQLRPLAHDGAAPATIALSVATYRTAAGADAVLSDPALRPAIHRLGGGATETDVEPSDVPLRMFRGVSEDAPGGRVTYIVQYRQDHVIGSVTVTQSSFMDDGGRLALSLAHNQATAMASSGDRFSPPDQSHTAATRAPAAREPAGR